IDQRPGGPVSSSASPWVQGAVVDGYGSGIADSRVTVVPLGPGKGKMETLRTTTDRKGRFTLELPTTHPVRIEAIHPRYGRGQLRVEGGDEPVEEAIVTLTQPNLDLEAWNARLAPFGATLWRDGDAVQVLEVEPSGVAARSGVTRGDFILSAKEVRDGAVRLELARDHSSATVTLIPSGDDDDQ
ncbi:MAG: carboxypeptidase-like regulatory domain-containing protein, partial [Myxococcota bacterium]